MLKHWIAQRNRSSRSALNTPCGLCPSEAPWSGFLCCMAASISFLILFSSDVCVSSLRHPSSDNDWSFSSSVLLVALISKSKMWKSNLKNKTKAADRVLPCPQPTAIIFVFASPASFFKASRTTPIPNVRSIVVRQNACNSYFPLSVSFTLLLPNRGRVGKKLLFGLDNNREHFWSLWTKKDCLILSFALPVCFVTIFFECETYFFVESSLSCK